MGSFHFTSRHGGILALLICTLIWGCAFVAQRMGMDSLGPCSFNAIRSFIGAIALVPCIVFLDVFNKRKPSLWGEAKSPAARRTLLVGGILCGIALGAASLSQQIGIVYTSVGKSGFLTALYIILVPILGIFVGHKVTPIIWAAACFAMLGMALLCNLSFDSGLNKGDCWLLLCSLLFAVQILLVAHYVLLTDCIRLSCIQFVAAGLTSLVVLPFTNETITWEAVQACVGPLLFCGVLSSGVAYTLQNVGEKYVHPVVATLLMSLEAVFSAFAGWIVLHQVLSGMEILGCTIIFFAVLLAQIRK